MLEKMDDTLVKLEQVEARIRDGSLKPEDVDLVLTTADNPVDPRENWEQWLNFDHEYQYDTNNYLARVISMHEGRETDDDELMSMLTYLTALKEIIVVGLRDWKVLGLDELLTSSK